VLLPLPLPRGRRHDDLTAPRVLGASNASTVDWWIPASCADVRPSRIMISQSLPFLRSSTPYVYTLNIDIDTVGWDSCFDLCILQASEPVSLSASASCQSSRHALLPRPDLPHADNSTSFSPHPRSSTIFPIGLPSLFITRICLYAFEFAHGMIKHD
jgi:hypothetical protein